MIRENDMWEQLGHDAAAVSIGIGKQRQRQRQQRPRVGDIQEDSEEGNKEVEDRASYCCFLHCSCGEFVL